MELTGASEIHYADKDSISFINQDGEYSSFRWKNSRLFKSNRNIVLSSSEQEGKLVFEVADDGAGMDYDIRKKIFTTFFSTKDSGTGTGLGLLTTRKIVQEHGGKVSFDSTKGAGSVFRLEFPWDRLPQPAEDVEGGEPEASQ